MEIAVGIDCNGFVVSGDEECCFGFVAGVEGAAHTAFFSFDVNPGDVMDVGHRVIDASDANIETGAAFAGRGFDDGKMFFAAGFDRIGFDGRHFIAAADRNYTGCVNEADEVSAFFTDIKFCVHN